jgi:hypothetical protein
MCTSHGPATATGAKTATGAATWTLTLSVPAAFPRHDFLPDAEQARHEHQVLLKRGSYKMQVSTLLLGSGVYGEQQAGPCHALMIQPRLCVEAINAID